MLFLLLTIISSLLNSVIVRYNEERRGNRAVVSAANYVVGAVITILLADGASLVLSPLWTAIGVLVGCGFIGGLMVGMVAVRHAGMGIPTSIANISLLIPVIVSIFLYDESPTPLRLAGMTVGVAAFTMLGLSQRGHQMERGASTMLALAGVFLITGAINIGLKAAQVEGIERYPFLLYVFGSAALIGWILVLVRREPVRRRDLLLGALLGVPNIFSAVFLVMALRELPAGVVFPIVSAGGVVAATVVGMIVWKERPNARAWIGIALAALALVLLGLDPG